jgi:L-fucose mutarotase
MWRSKHRTENNQTRIRKEENGMLKSQLLHPEILRALAGAGHGAQVLIADGNYPASTGVAPTTTRVYLNLAPGLITATDALRVLATAIPIEAAHVMQTADGSEPPVLDEFRALLPGLALVAVERFAFYRQASEPSTCLVIATGEQRVYANILLTVGVVSPEKG